MNAAELHIDPTEGWTPAGLALPQYLTCRDHRRGHHRPPELPRDCAATVVARHWSQAEADAARAWTDANTDAELARIGRLMAGGDGRPDTAAGAVAAARHRATCARGWHAVRTMVARSRSAWCALVAVPGAAAADTLDLSADDATGWPGRHRRHDHDAGPPIGAELAAANLTPHAPPFPAAVSARTDRREEMT